MEMILTLSDLLTYVNDSTLIDLYTADGKEINRIPDVVTAEDDVLEPYYDCVVVDVSVWKDRLVINIDEEAY